MKDIYTREERLGITRTPVLSMIGQGLLFAISLILMFLILLLLSV